MAPLWYPCAPSLFLERKRSNGAMSRCHATILKFLFRILTFSTSILLRMSRPTVPRRSTRSVRHRPSCSIDLSREPRLSLSFGSIRPIYPGSIPRVNPKPWKSIRRESSPTRSRPSHHRHKNAPPRRIGGPLDAQTPCPRRPGRCAKETNEEAHEKTTKRARCQRCQARS